MFQMIDSVPRGITHDGYIEYSVNENIILDTLNKIQSSSDISTHYGDSYLKLYTRVRIGIAYLLASR